MKTIYLIDSQKPDLLVTSTIDLARAMKARGSEVTIMCRNEHPLTEAIAAADVASTTAPMLGIYDIISPVMLSRMIKGSEPTVLHAIGMPSAYIASRAKALADNPKVKVVVTINDLHEAPKRKLDRECISGVDAWIFTSEMARERFMMSKPEIPENRIHTIIDVPDYPQPTSGVTAVKADDRLTLLYRGEITADCGLDVVIGAMKLLKGRNLRLIVAGDGEESVVSPLKRDARASGVDSRIDWRKADHRVVELMESADAAVAMGWSLPSTILEYMHYGVPVIGAIDGIAAEFVTPDKDGILTERDAKKLVKALAEFRAEKQSLSEGAAEKAGSYGTWADKVDRISALYKEITDDKNQD